MNNAVTVTPRLSTRRILVSLASALSLSWAHAAEPIVIGQSLPLSGAGGFATGNRVQEGALAYVNFINEKGGVHGRPLKLVTLDDGNDPKVHAGNVRQLVAKEGAVVIVNCLDDTACKSGAAAAAELGVPLVGPPGRHPRTAPARRTARLQRSAIARARGGTAGAPAAVHGPHARGASV